MLESREGFERFLYGPYINSAHSDVSLFVAFLNIRLKINTGEPGRALLTSLRYPSVSSSG